MKHLLRAGCVALWLAGCASDSYDSNLPAGWEAAERIEELKQVPCNGSALTARTPEALEAMAAEGGVEVSYDHAHFRCAQDVEGFVKRGRGALDLLVQPVDMNPKAISKCACRYDVSMQVPAAPGDYKLTLFRRRDSVNHPNDPVKIGEADVSVE